MKIYYEFDEKWQPEGQTRQMLEERIHEYCVEHKLRVYYKNIGPGVLIFDSGRMPKTHQSGIEAIVATQSGIAHYENQQENIPMVQDFPMPEPEPAKPHPENDFISRLRSKVRERYGV